MSGHGIAIGADEYQEEHSTGSVGAVVEAKEGDAVTLSHSVDTAGGEAKPAPKPAAKPPGANIVTLDELKTRAAKDAKKSFTIRADEDVSYAKVIEVVEALKAAGVAEVSISVARVGDAKSRATIRGKVLKPDGAPAAGVLVRVDDGIERWKFRGEGIPDLPQPVTTVADGTFSIEVPKGSVATNYNVFTDSDAFAPMHATVPVGGDVGVMQFAKGSHVSGRVIGLDGEGLAKVGIWCKRLDWLGRGPAPAKLTSTGGDGTFSIPSIATGKYLLVIATGDLGVQAGSLCHLILEWS